jgi:phage tail-like protein
MPVFNPVPNFKFQIFLLNRKPGGGVLPQSVSEAISSVPSLAVGIGLSVLFGSFSEASGLTAQIETEEYREGGRNVGPHKFMKWGKYPNVILKRGVTFNTDIWDWYFQVLNGSRDPLRKNGIIILNDRGGGLTNNATGLSIPVVDTLPVAVWFFRNGLPEKLDGPGLKGSGNEIAIESLEIAHEGLIRLGAAQIPFAGETLTTLGF